MREEDPKALPLADELRRRAEEVVAGGRPMDRNATPEQVAEVTHELQVHQIELEMQNRSLRETQAELEQSRDRYADLYDFAPVGYLTLDGQGLIRECNLTAAELFGVERARLLGHPLVGWINHGGKNPFLYYLRQCRETPRGRELTAEVHLRSKHRGDVPVQFRTMVVGDPGEGEWQYRMAILDVSDRRQTEIGIADLARFPEENPNPVMRVLADGTVLYANHPAEALLEAMGWVAGAKLPAALQEPVDRVALGGTRIDFDVEAGDRVYSMTISPGAAGKDVSLYFRDVTARKEAEAAAIQAKEDWERTFDTVPDLIAILDRYHRIVRVNRAMAQKLGTQPEQCTGLACFECIHGTDSPPEFCPHSLTLADGRQHTVEVREDRLDGCFLVTTTPMFNADGELIGSVHVARDITEQKRAEQALRESREELNRAQTVAQVGSWRLDLRCNALTWSDETLRIFGVGEGGAMSYETFLDSVHPDDQAYVHEKWSAALGGELYDVEHRIVVNGRVKWVREKAELEFGDDGAPHSALGITQDITEKKLAEQALQRLNETLEQQVAERTAAIQMLHDVASMANQAKDVGEALAYSLRRTGEHGGWSFGHVLFPADDDHDTLRPSCVWYADASERFRPFHELTLNNPSRRGRGLSGRVYASGKAEWTTDLRAALVPARAELAERLGIRTAASFPILVEKRVVGVLEFFSDQVVEPGGEMQDWMLGIGTQIGRAIERKAFQDRLLTLAEEEHRRIGQELHDDVGQELTGLALKMETLSEELGKEEDGRHTLARKIVEAMDRTRRKCRALSRGLMPAEIAAAELPAALNDLVLRTGENYGVACRFQCVDCGPASGNQMATQLYRIAREAVANAVAHSRAKNIVIELVMRPEETVLNIQDDGVGIPPQSERGSGMGIQIMRYRAGLIGGRMEIDSLPGGTLIVCRVTHGPAKRP
ncbi:MAG TPA: PAS domain S-box protein [Thermoguttaceae bacterium]|nr:PAS domain S-box protein [Thermoguttaceae bacterium]